MTEPFTQGDDDRKELTAGNEASGRLDAWLTGVLDGDLSRVRVKALITGGEVTVNGKTVREAKHRIKPGDRVTLTIRNLRTRSRGRKIFLSTFSLMTTTSLSWSNRPGWSFIPERAIPQELWSTACFIIADRRCRASAAFVVRESCTGWTRTPAA